MSSPFAKNCIAMCFVSAYMRDIDMTCERKQDYLRSCTRRLHHNSRREMTRKYHILISSPSKKSDPLIPSDPTHDKVQKQLQIVQVLYRYRVLTLAPSRFCSILFIQFHHSAMQNQKVVIFFFKQLLFRVEILRYIGRACFVDHRVALTHVWKSAPDKMTAWLPHH